MKKINFSDKYALTQAVLEGRKTQTRRIVPRSFFTCTYDILDNNTLVCEDMYGDWHDIRKTRYALQVGEGVAVAQSYKDCGYDANALDRSPKDLNVVRGTLGESKGWNNKMFVRADACKHRIRITDVRVERLQDISDEDCMAEGLVCENVYGNPEPQMYETEYRLYYTDNIGRDCALVGKTSREAYAALIDKISGKGTFQSNPYVFAYTFELVK